MAIFQCLRGISKSCFRERKNWALQAKFFAGALIWYCEENKDFRQQKSRGFEAKFRQAL